MAGNDLIRNIDRVYRVDQGQDNGDDFGLPSTGSTSGGGSTPKPVNPAKKPVSPPEKSSSGGLIAVLVIIGVVIIAFLVYWFAFRKPPVKKTIVVKPDTTAVQPKPDTIVQAPPVETKPATPSVGQIDTITSRTGRYYVIISTSIDDDLAHDYAKKLSKQGVNCTILGSSAKKGYHQLSVADFGTLKEANDKAAELRDTYGKNVWVMKY